MSQQWGSHRQFQEDQSRGYVRLYGPRAFGAAQAVRPLQATRAKVEQEYPSGRGGYAGFLTPPVAYGGVQAVRPLQATKAQIAQEWSLDRWSGYQKLSGPVGYGAAQAVLPLQASRATVAQEWPWYWTGYQQLQGPIGFGAAQASRPLQSATAQTRQEWPGYHPYPVPTSPPTPASGVRPLQSATARVTQELPWHPSPWMSAPFPVSAVLPLQGIKAQTTQELPWHPAPWLSAPFHGSQPSAAPWGVTARTALEWPWHPAPWASGSFLPNFGPPQQGMAVSIRQEWPGYHPLPATAMGPAVSAVTPLQSAAVRISQEWPWYFTGYQSLTGPVGFGASQAARPLQSSRAQVSQEWPWHPLSVLGRPFPVSAVTPLAGVVAKVTQEIPWHPLPWTAGSFIPAPLTTSFVLQPNINVRQEWPGYHPYPSPMAPPAPASAVRPLQATLAAITQEWPTDRGGYAGFLKPPIAYGAVQAVQPLQAAAVRIGPEWPGYHPYPILLRSYNFAPQPLPPQPLRTIPDGNWRSIVDPAARFTLPDLNTLSPQIGEIGFTLFLNTPIAQSAQIADMTLVFVKPSGATLQVLSALFVAGLDPVAAALNYQHSFVGYTFGPGDLDEVGVWSVYLTLRGSRVTGIATFQVLGTVH